MIITIINERIDYGLLLILVNVNVECECNVCVFH